jgi:hypothetical protein
MTEDNEWGPKVAVFCDEDSYFEPSETWDSITIVLFGDNLRNSSVVDEDGKIVSRVQKIDVTLEVGSDCMHGSLLRVLATPDGRTLTHKFNDRYVIACQLVHVRTINIVKYEDNDEGRKQCREDWPLAC